MNKIQSLLTTILVTVLLFSSATAVLGQQHFEPNYEVSLQLLMGTNDGGKKGILHSNLSAISQRLKSSFAYSNYWLAETLFCRISNRGKFEYRSGTNMGREVVIQPQSFLDLTVSDLWSGQTAKGGQGFMIESFRFGARVPVTNVTKDDAGKERSATNYEQIGLTLNKVGLPENVPTLVGTLNLPGPNDTIFLVMTIKSVDL